MTLTFLNLKSQVAFYSIVKEAVVMAQWLKLNSVLHLKAESYSFKPCVGLMIQCNCMFAGKQLLAALVWLRGLLPYKKPKKV